MGDRRALRALVTGLAVGVVIACAACTETGGGPGPTTGSAAATGAVTGSGGFKGGYDPSTKFTQLTAMFLTTPAPVEMTDGKVHLTYELVLTNAAPIPFQVDKIELHDAATSALVPNTTGRVDITPLAGGTEAEGTTDPAPATPRPPSRRARPMSPGWTSCSPSGPRCRRPSSTS